MEKKGIVINWIPSQQLSFIERKRNEISAMKKNSLIDTYLQNYSTGGKWNLIANDTENISQVVVIPAYAEKEMLFSTLASIAQNPTFVFGIFFYIVCY